MMGEVHVREDAKTRMPVSVWHCPFSPGAEAIKWHFCCITVHFHDFWVFSHAWLDLVVTETPPVLYILLCFWDTRASMMDTTRMKGGISHVGQHLIQMFEKCSSITILSWGVMASVIASIPLSIWTSVQGWDDLSRLTEWAWMMDGELITSGNRCVNSGKNVVSAEPLVKPLSCLW
jgi:hypothetical protein